MQYIALPSGVCISEPYLKLLLIELLVYVEADSIDSSSATIDSNDSSGNDINEKDNLELYSSNTR